MRHVIMMTLAIALSSGLAVADEAENEWFVAAVRAKRFFATLKELPESCLGTMKFLATSGGKDAPSADMSMSLVPEKEAGTGRTFYRCTFNMKLGGPKKIVGTMGAVVVFKKDMQLRKYTYRQMISGAGPYFLRVNSQVEFKEGTWHWQKVEDKMGRTFSSKGTLPVMETAIPDVVGYVFAIHCLKAPLAQRLGVYLISDDVRLQKTYFERMRGTTLTVNDQPIRVIPVRQIKIGRGGRKHTTTFFVDEKGILRKVEKQDLGPAMLVEFKPFKPEKSKDK